ncbi:MULTISPECIES: restriction endonuclease subunit S [Aliivibrio]|uniref:Type I restriction modification DNA specificity domain-containing protein n=1 Tax=Aliivibrio finisterrensis TaxID=511998 RepID=A0A4Q5KRQ0_9GAMM|nr:MULTISPECIES: restriction endonuclease subunit S [Aliivibrio]MDD9180019.1 restriction endonuclease subunit S [Aliivibrio sp. A6]RYU49767.1 hypothetical protein ERW57_14230 [Aliivibrio finisterrensis]RYU51340.1 hypothetical protein ERW56_12890 [Aliivibrio finisterrensis]RYU56401.1 hypothetical protein ERW50_14510 [Aliivibrio finisterrensis]RYU63905.1 hypothetical protein ERW53_11995 [Aliivibrio finisterrensis]
MSELPKGWVECELKQLISITSGKNLTQKKMIEGTTPVFGGNGITGWHNEGNVFKPTIVIGRVGFYCGSVYITPENAWITDNAFITSFSEAHIDREFLYWLLKFTDLRQNDSSSAQPVISGQKVYPIQVKLPPLAEQKRIVEKLDEVLAQVDTIKARLDGIPSLLKRFRQSVLASAVSGKLTEEWRGEEKRILDEVSNLPQSWQIKAANEVCIKVQSGSTPRNDPFNQGGTVPFLKVYNIVNQKVDFDYKPQFVTTDTHQDKLKRSIAFPGDVLMNIVGPPLGKVAILTDQYPEWNLNQAITLFRANNELLINKYLYFVLCEGALVRDVMPETKGSVGQINISLTQCRESKVPLPPLEEQKEIVRLVGQYFAFADTIEAQVKKAQARVNNLTQSILAKAFRGELVPQDPNDEPADKLLERIAQARIEAETLAKAAKKAETARKKTEKATAKG